MLSLALSLLALPAGCGAKQPPPHQTSVATLSIGADAGTEDATDAAPPETLEKDAGATLPPAATPEDVAQRWLEALRRADAVLLSTWSRYPFLLHDTGAEGTCGHGAAASAGQLPLLLGCLLHNEPLLIELRANPDAAPLVLKPKDLPGWARRWRNEIPQEATLVQVDISGRGTSSHFVFVIHDGGVRALWKETVFERG